ncbi:Uncharacterised protein [Escherichia coli]|uniref:Uncharacterized protein n=1 Tax=Escherichia coli TaxID=562 RepID=A0A377CYN8_ECOLX|nr:Uncharacterised protein [Escherichia coli]
MVVSVHPPVTPLKPHQAFAPQIKGSIRHCLKVALWHVAAIEILIDAVLRPS